MTTRKRTRTHRRGIRHRLKPKLRRRRERRTYLAAGIVDSERAPLRVDEELWNGFVYSVGLHARNPAVSLHDLSFDGFSFWIMLTADPKTCQTFLESVARDFAGYLRAYTGDDELRIHPDWPIPLGELMGPGAQAGSPEPC